MDQSKYKRSRQRERILGILRDTDTHPTVSWIYEQLRTEFSNLSIGTVYRNINILIDQNLVKKIEAGSSFNRFDANTDLHYHFICRICSSVDDLPLKALSGLNKKAADSTNYRVESHRLDFYGLCPSCSLADQNKPG